MAKRGKMPHPFNTSHPFQMFFVARTLSMLGDSVVPMALALSVLQVTGSSTALAAILASATIPRLLLLPLAGVSGDRFNARLLALGTDLVRFACQLLTGVELLTDDLTLWQIVLMQALAGAASAFALPISSPLLVSMVREEQLSSANSALSSARNVSRLIGPALAGLLIFADDSGWAFIFDSATFALSAVLMLFLRVPDRMRQKSSLGDDLKRGWREVISRDWYRASVAAHFVWNGAAAIWLTLGPTVVVDELGGETTWVVTVQVGAIGLLIGSVVTDRIPARRPVLASNLAAATLSLPLIFLAVHAPSPLVIASYAVSQIGVGIFNPMWDTVIQRAFPSHVLARVTSYDWLLSLAAAPLGYAVAPLAAGAWGVEAPLTAAALLVLVSCLATALVPGVRRFGVSRCCDDALPETQPVTSAKLGLRDETDKGSDSAWDETDKVRAP